MVKDIEEWRTTILLVHTGRHKGLLSSLVVYVLSSFDVHSLKLTNLDVHRSCRIR